MTTFPDISKYDEVVHRPLSEWTNIGAYRNIREGQKFLQPEHIKTTFDLILERGDLNYFKDKKFMFGGSLLNIAVQNSHEVGVRILLANGYDPNPALEDAVWKGNLKFVELLLANGADVNQGTPLHTAAWYDQRQIARVLIDAKIDLNKTWPRGETALQIAVEENHPMMVEILLNAGCKNEINNEKTPLLIAIEKGYLEVVAHFIAKGVDVNSYYYFHSPLASAIYSGNVALVELLIRSDVDINAQDKNHDFRRRPLHAAVKIGNKEMVKLLIDADVDVNLTDDSGRAAIYYANEPIMKMLIEAGATCDTLDGDIQTILFAAVCRGYELPQIREEWPQISAADENNRRVAGNAEEARRDWNTNGANSEQ